MYIVGCLPALLAYLVQCRYLTNRWVTLVGEFFFQVLLPSLVEWRDLGGSFMEPIWKWMSYLPTLSTRVLRYPSHCKLARCQVIIYLLLYIVHEVVCMCDRGYG